MPKKQSNRKNKGKKSKKGGQTKPQTNASRNGNLALNDITFNFIQSCNDLRTMKRVVSMLENEQFRELKEEAQRKLEELTAAESKSSEETLEPSATEETAEEMIKRLQAAEELLKQLPKSRVPPVRNSRGNGTASAMSASGEATTGGREAIEERVALSEKTKGNECFKAGDYQDAINHYTRGIKTWKKHAPLYANRAACHLKLDHFQEAASDCTKALELDGNYVKAYCRRGEAHMGLRRLKSALSDFEQGLALEPNNSVMKRHLAVVKKKLAKKNQKGFRVPIETVTSDESKAESKEPSTRIQVEQGSFSDEDNAQGDEKEAAAAATVPPTQPSSTPQQASTSRPKKQYPKAEAIKTEGNGLFKNGQYDDAIAKYKRAVNAMKDCKPDSNVPFEWYELTCSCLNNHALCASQFDDFTQVIRVSSDCIRLLDEVNEVNLSVNTMYWKALFRRALAYDKAGKVELGLDDMQRAYGVLPSASHKTQSELVRLRREFAEDVSATANEAKERGNKLYREQKFEEALEIYSSAIELCKRADRKISLRGSLKTTTTNLMSNRGLVLSKLNRLEEAIDEYTYILGKIEPDHVKSRKRRATCLEHLGQLRGAQRDWEQLKSMGQDVDECDRHLSDILQRLPDEETEVTEENEIPLRHRRAGESFIEFEKAWSRVKSDPSKVFQLCVFVKNSLARLLKSNLSRNILESLLGSIQSCGLSSEERCEESLHILECLSDCDKLSLTMMMITDKTQLPAVLDSLSQVFPGNERIDCLRRKFNMQ